MCITDGNLRLRDLCPPTLPPLSRAAQEQPPECEMDRMKGSARSPDRDPLEHSWIQLWWAVARVTKTNLFADPRLMLVKRFMNPTV